MVLSERIVMEKVETQIDIINRLLPGSKFTKTEKVIVDQLESLEKDERLLLAAYPLSEEVKNNLLEEAHPYLVSLLQKLQESGNFIFESFSDWYDLKSISYDVVLQYLQGKVAYQVLAYNYIRTEQMSEEELKAFVTKKRNILQLLLKNTILDTTLPLEDKWLLYQELHIMDNMASLDMIRDYDSRQTFEEISISGSAMLLAKWYYKYQDDHIESYIEDIIKPEIEYRGIYYNQNTKHSQFIKTKNT